MESNPPSFLPLGFSSSFAVDAPPSCVALFVQVTQLKGDLKGEEGMLIVLVQLLNSE